MFRAERKDGAWISAATFVSIILGVGVADLLMNFHRLLHEHNRVRWDALPLVWAVIALLWIINFWWAVAGNLMLVWRLSVQSVG